METKSKESFKEFVKKKVKEIAHVISCKRNVGAKKRQRTLAAYHSSWKPREYILTVTLTLPKISKSSISRPSAKVWTLKNTEGINIKTAL